MVLVYNVIVCLKNKNIYIRMPKLLRITPSPKPEKKWRATFLMDTGREKNVDFGARGMEDYLQHRSQTRRQRYIARHSKDLKTLDPTRAGYLSMYILWGPHTSMSQNIAAYKRKFGL
jgi:hypothetical protein